VKRIREDAAQRSQEQDKIIRALRRDLAAAVSNNNRLEINEATTAPTSGHDVLWMRQQQHQAACGAEHIIIGPGLDQLAASDGGGADKKLTLLEELARRITSSPGGALEEGQAAGSREDGEGDDREFDEDGTSPLSVRYKSIRAKYALVKADLATALALVEQAVRDEAKRKVREDLDRTAARGRLDDNLVWAMLTERRRVEGMEARNRLDMCNLYAELRVSVRQRAAQKTLLRAVTSASQYHSHQSPSTASPLALPGGGSSQKPLNVTEDAGGEMSFKRRQGPQDVAAVARPASGPPVSRAKRTSSVVLVLEDMDVSSSPVARNRKAPPAAAGGPPPLLARGELRDPPDD
jgi:hypothetical protein